MLDGSCTVTIPIRIELDASSAHAVEIVEEAVGAALSRAIAASLDAVVRTRAAQPALGAQPSFAWAGDGLASIDSAARSRIEAAVLASVGECVAGWPEGATLPAADRTSSLTRLANSALPRTSPGTPLAPFGTRTSEVPGALTALPPTELWTRWIALASAAGSPGEADTDVRREALRAAAFTERFGRAVAFVPEGTRIVARGFAPQPDWEERLRLMVGELERGFIAAFAAALDRRETLDAITAVAVVPLVSIVNAYLVQDGFRAERISPQALMRALERAFPATDLRQLCGAASSVDYDRLVRRNSALEVFFEALATRGFDDAHARAATEQFVHGLFEALAGTYRQLMMEALHRIVAVQRAFRSDNDGAQSPGPYAAHLTQEFDRAVASVADRTPLAALAAGRETAIVAERVHAALRTLSARSAEWRADIRPVAHAAGGARFVLALHPPDLDDDDLRYYEGPAGREIVRGVLRGYVLMRGEWDAAGALGLVWRTGFARLDAVLEGIVAEVRAEEPAQATFFLDEPYG